MCVYHIPQIQVDWPLCRSHPLPAAQTHTRLQRQQRPDRWHIFFICQDICISLGRAAWPLWSKSSRRTQEVFSTFQCPKTVRTESHMLIYRFDDTGIIFHQRMMWSLTRKICACKVVDPESTFRNGHPPAEGVFDRCFVQCSAFARIMSAH